MMTLEQAQKRLSAGDRFGEVFPFLDTPDDAELLRTFFCYKLKWQKPKAAPIPGTTGEFCPQCGGANVKKTGTCSVCIDCGTSVGGCS